MGIKKWAWALLGVASLGFRWVASNSPEWTEHYYSRGLFLFIRQAFDKTLGNLPFPSVFLFILLIGFLFLWFLRKLVQIPKGKPRWIFSLRSLLNFSGALIFFFLILWGFNYQRTFIIQQLGIEVKPLNLEQLEHEIEESHHQLVSLRKKIKADTSAIEEIVDYRSLESQVRKNLSQNLELVKLEYFGNPRTRMFPPPGFMRKMGILGIYFPYTGESYIDPTLHPLEQPFTIAHEMAHSFGVTDEGEANFVAWVVGTRSSDPLLKYTAYLRLFLYQARDYYRMDPDGYRVWLEKLDRGVLQDIRSIQDRNAQYPPFSIELSRKTNDLFLKSQGVKAGVLSYQQLPMLVYAWKQKAGN
ncbi:DUF3810 domain-containing protein [Algoriphagus limi]|uniref:DUF3810 domain-containing protein n=1 Tax=Algoriphagus limi TaxID=2975273 RepID=A0ABT2G5Q3_9BACT|nr:DUF3810 domain-containing protein [Algoriphagus limi]MCS5490584.1 DUF3810 domain-containing protein [Algoriphagus limi]